MEDVVFVIIFFLIFLDVDVCYSVLQIILLFLVLQQHRVRLSLSVLVNTLMILSHLRPNLLSINYWVWEISRVYWTK